MLMVFLLLGAVIKMRQNASMSSELKERIKLRLNELGKSARAISLEAGLGSEAISNVLRERSRYSRGDTLRDLASALECSIDWLMTGQNGEGRVFAATETTEKRIPEIDIRAGMGGGGEVSVTMFPTAVAA